MSNDQKACANCGLPVPFKPIAVTDGAFAAVAARLSLLCDSCAAEQDAADAERERREAAEQSIEAVERRFKRSELPAKHRQLLRDLDHSGAILDAAQEWAKDGGGLLLSGEVGVGKTTIAGAACWLRLQSKLVIWTSAPLLFARLGSGLGSNQRDWALDLLQSKHALVLDDIDKARPTEYGAEQVFLAIDQRVEHEAPLLVTSNLSPGQLADKWPEPYGPAIASRLVGYCRVVPVLGVDRRLQSTTTEGASA